MKLSVSTFLATIALAILVAPTAKGQIVVADYTDDFPGEVGSPNHLGFEFPNIAPGWQYLWNAPSDWTVTPGSGDPMNPPEFNEGSSATRAGGLFGNPTNYVDLLPNFETPVWTIFTPDGSNNAAGTGGSYMQIGRGQIQPGMTHFQGDFPPDSAPILEQDDRFAIAAFTVSAPGLYEIQRSQAVIFGSGNPQNPNSWVDPNNPTIGEALTGEDGLRIAIHVNSDPLLFDQRTGRNATPKQFIFDTPLGFLNAGDTIYVGVAAGNNDYSDFSLFDYSIVRTAVPEPTTSALMLLGCCGALVSRRRARREQA